MLPNAIIVRLALNIFLLYTQIDVKMGRIRTGEDKTEKEGGLQRTNSILNFIFEKNL